MYSIIPLDVGDLEMDKSQVILGDTSRVIEKEKLIAYYIKGNSQRILVDTGPHPLGVKGDEWFTFTPLIRSRQSDSQLLENVLKHRLGLSPDDIDLVILTHLHWDHAGGIDKFRKSEIIVSERELNFAMNPILPRSLKGYLAFQAGMTPPFSKVMKNIKTVKMREKKIRDGIRVIPTPGHTPGSIAVCVDTSKGTYVITGDAVNSYENINGNPKLGFKYNMLGIYMNQIEAWESFEAIDEQVGGDHSRVLPGHDVTIFERAAIP
jgi:N-acyl homoserine lactone hydrolase